MIDRLRDFFDDWRRLSLDLGQDDAVLLVNRLDSKWRVARSELDAHHLYIKYDNFDRWRDWVAVESVEEVDNVVAFFTDAQELIVLDKQNEVVDDKN